MEHGHGLFSRCAALLPIAAELAPCLMFPAAASGEDRDERGRAVFVTRLIRVMLARAPTES